MAIRITPACAGKRPPQQTTVATTQDHPCVCREKFGDCNLKAVIVGSPLRVQGKAIIVITVRFAVRITPACAGKS